MFSFDMTKLFSIESFLLVAFGIGIGFLIYIHIHVSIHLPIAIKENKEAIKENREAIKDLGKKIDANHRQIIQILLKNKDRE